MSIAFFKKHKSSLVSREKQWNNQDIADFYRAMEILTQAGLETEVDSGITDEGDPWFVFIRPDTGDVVAHFARIDGLFLAVSAVNQEVFRGKNLREIVDRMLDRHPALLPQSKGGNKFLLHPTAAISAFLAAAFIMTIDGLQEVKISDIVAAARSQNGTEIGSGPENGATAAFMSKIPVLKTMLSDFNYAGYNVAVLGAALIAHDLSAVDESFGEWVSRSDNFVNAQEDSIHDRKSEEQEFVSSQVDGRWMSIHNEGVYAYKKLDDYACEEQCELTLNNEHIFGDGVSAEKLENSNKVLQVLQAPEGKFELALEADNINQKSQFYLDIQAISPEVNDKYQRAGETFNKDDENYFVTDVPLSDDDSFQSEILGQVTLVDSNVLMPEGVGLTVDVNGDLKVVSIDKSADFKGVNVSLDLSFLELAENIDESEVVQLSSASEQESPVPYPRVENYQEQAPESVGHDFPIVGHSFNNPNEILQLTDGIDVVFYKGGRAEIAGFELGKDLLWSFLSADALNSANQSVNYAGDLVLDFGGQSVLTFLGVVPSANFDAIT